MGVPSKVSRAGPPRTTRSHDAICQAARTVFLRDGFSGASVDEIVALASVSKQTVYRHFTDKRGLFAAGVLDALESTYDQYAPALEALARTNDIARDLGRYARSLLSALMTPDVLQLRRLMIAEANRFPDLGRTYYARTYERTTEAMTGVFEGFAQRGILDLDDASLAAHHFAWLVLGIPRNQVMLCGDATRFTPAELRRFADAGAKAFLAIYGTTDLMHDVTSPRIETKKRAR
jgi:TetR/AcrR family transcriptional repressor of mexJK operon